MGLNLEGYSMTRLSLDLQSTAEGGQFISVTGSLNGKGLKKSFHHKLSVVVRRNKPGKYIIKTDDLQFITSPVQTLPPTVKIINRSVPSSSNTHKVEKLIDLAAQKPEKSYADAVKKGKGFIAPEKSFAGAVEKELKAKKVTLEYSIHEEEVMKDVCFGYIEEMPISVVCHSDVISSKYHYDILWKLEGNYSVDLKFLDMYDEKMPKVIVEGINCGIRTWLHKLHKLFVAMKERVEGVDWWTFISKKFLIVFERVIVCMVGIYKQKVYHGNLIEGIAFTNSMEIKLFNMRKDYSINDVRAYKRDMKHLKDIMDEVIGYGYPNVDHDQLYMKLPPRIRSFLEKLGKCNFHRDRIISFLDDGTFWGPKSRYDFMDRLHILLWQNKTYGPVIRNTLNSFLQHWHWITLVPEAGPLREVFETANRRNNKEFGVQPYKDAVDAIRYWRNTQHHYNQFSAHFTLPLEIEEEFDRVLDICYKIREAMEDYFICDNLDGFKWKAREYAKKHMRWNWNKFDK